MSWRKPTLKDIAATLSQRELDAYRTSPDFESAADPVEDLLSRTASYVRGFCRKNKQVKMCPTEGTVPESLISPAMDYAAFDILKRLPVAMNEDRKTARQQAMELFKDVASGAYIPESYSEEGEIGDDDSGMALPGFCEQRVKILNEML